MRRVLTAAIYTRSTEVMLPPGVLTAGQPHYVEIRATWHPDVSYEQFLTDTMHGYSLSSTHVSTAPFVP